MRDLERLCGQTHFFAGRVGIITRDLHTRLLNVAYNEVTLEDGADAGTLVADHVWLTLLALPAWMKREGACGRRVLMEATVAPYVKRNGETSYKLCPVWGSLRSVNKGEGDEHEHESRRRAS